MKRIITKVLICLGICFLLFGIYLLWERTNPRRLSFSYKQIASYPKTLHGAKPARIIIQKEHINLPIYPAEVKNNNWATTTQGVSYLITSPLPGEKGNSIIYGHNWANLFGNITSVRPGDSIQVIFSDKTVKNFSVEYTSIVSPSDSQILAPSQDTRITLYTCAGFLDEQRFVAVALLDNPLTLK